jgi:hypothetical protein
VANESAFGKQCQWTAESLAVQVLALQEASVRKLVVATPETDWLAFSQNFTLELLPRRALRKQLSNLGTFYATEHELVAAAMEGDLKRFWVQGHQAGEGREKQLLPSEEVWIWATQFL